MTLKPKKMTEHEYRRIFRETEWEKVKGQLAAILATYKTDYNAPIIKPPGRGGQYSKKVQTHRFEQVERTIKEFIDKVDDEDLMGNQWSWFDKNNPPEGF